MNFEKLSNDCLHFPEEMIKRYDNITETEYEKAKMVTIKLLHKNVENKNDLDRILFTKESLRSQSPTIKLKGKFLSIALITFVIGVLIPYISIDISALIISRLTLIVSAIGFYIGFMLPKWVENLFIKG